MWAVGALIYGAVVFNVNNKLLQDSNSLNWIMLVMTVISSKLFFVVFYLVNLVKYDELYGFFFKVGHYPQIILIFLLLILFIWPINTFTYFWLHSGKKERRDRLIERNMHLKTDLKEEEGELLLSIAASMPKDAHTGFAFSGEEGHVPQITENLKR